MHEQLLRLQNTLTNGLTPYHVNELTKTQLLQNGYIALFEEDDWALEEGGKYFVERDGSLIAFALDNLDNLSFKIAAAHTDACALKLKGNFLVSTPEYTKVNVEPYGGGVWYSFFDRPLKIAGRVIYEKDGSVIAQTVQSPYCVQIPSVAIHFNREVNERFAVNPQIDLLPLLSLQHTDEQAVFQSLGVSERVLAHDLFLVSAESAFDSGMQSELLSSPRVDNLTSVQAVLEALLSHQTQAGVCVGAFFNHEEVGNHSAQGAGGDFLENTLRRIAYSLRFNEIEFFKAMANSFLLSVDNAHAVHPNHPEKSDITNKTEMGKGIVIKSHAKQSYATTGVTSAVLKSIFEKANVPYQTFYNRSDAKSGATLGNICMSRFGIHGADIGLAQLAMHSALECFAKADYTALIDGVSAFYSTPLSQKENVVFLR
ncbi:MAG: M18 family aminopeptidase [Clostridia bacterium]|nr:M18 family aminopeptidase [Clostridia bacterium]